MTKAELRKARKATRAAGGRLPEFDDRGDAPGAEAFTESARGYRARERWVRHYDSLNGAPESDDDR